MKRNEFKFENYNANPFKKKTGDCVIRAVSVALKEEWEDTYKGMFDVAMTTGYAISCKENFREYLKQKGYEKQKMPRRADRSRYTIREFVDELAKPNKTYIINIANHLTCVKNKTLYDLWNCGNKSVGNYWEV